MNQGAILLAYLRTYGRTSCRELETMCDVRSVTKRMSELTDQGFPIVKDVDWEPNSRGKLRRVTYYDLDGDHAQQDLFKTA